jgi:hypothetical protein
VKSKSPSVGRNEPCHCGSGKKYKYCHGATSGGVTNGQRWLYTLVAIAIVGGLILAVTSRSDDAPTPGGVWSAEHGHYH